MSMDWDEAKVIKRIHSRFPTRSELTPCGIGDDCALVNMRTPYVLMTTDASVEDIHFDLNWMSCGDAAYRCMTSNISDVAAMGAEAGAFSLALGLPASMSFDQIDDIIQGFHECVSDHGLGECWLVGGDVVRSRSLFFSVTVLARRPEWPVVQRDGAMPGDVVLVVGNVGKSAVGLELLSRHYVFDGPVGMEFVKAFRRPMALSRLGPLIAQNRLATSMMDVSDGIMMDLPRLLERSGCGCIVNLDCFVPTQSMASLAVELGRDPLDWMLCGGEDFALLMTVEEKNVNAVMTLADSFHVGCLNIGKCVAGNGMRLFQRGIPVERTDCSFKHF